MERPLPHPRPRYWAHLMVLALAALPAGTRAATNFLAGADLSLLAWFESQGVTYWTNGAAGDALAILKSQGVNCVRLRLFTSSAAQAAADPYNHVNNLAYTIPLAVRVKSAGLQFLLDFHYSDTWADPGHQAVPSTWAPADFASLTNQVRAYNSNCLAAFRAAGAPPDFVQIGNEITGGLLWPWGAVPGTNAAVQWGRLGQLLDAAILGIHDATPESPPKIIVHIDRGGDWAGTRWFFDNLILTQHVQFDLIGETYYPFWQGALNDLSNCLANTALSYGKPVLVAETSFPWTNSYWTTNLDGLPGSAGGQAEYATALARLVRNVPSGLGAGVFWWGAEYQAVPGVNEAGFDTTSWFDKEGNQLPAPGVWGRMVAPLVLGAAPKGAGVVFQWPLSGAGTTLWSGTNLSSTPGWSPVTNPVQFDGTNFNTTVPAIGAFGRFFRLEGH